MTARAKIAAAAPSQVHVLDAVKAARFKAKTMLIPSPADVGRAISAIPAGETLTLKDLRTKLAKDAGADVACPFATGVGWRLVAEAAEESGTDATPWWRVTSERKVNPKLPGGGQTQRDRLRAEGVQI